jgi:hypothetical protein
LSINPRMDAEQVERIETGVERGASALFAVAVGYALYAALGALVIGPALGVCAAGAGALAFLPCSRILGAAGQRGASFELPAFELRSLEEFEAADELQLTDADRLHPPDELLLTDADRRRPQDELILTDADRLDGTEPLLLDDILAEIGSDARVVRLFDRKAMPTPGQLHSRVAAHIGEAAPLDAPADAAHALSAALAELRRSLA